MRNAIVLAAGKGTRMHSDLPKVLHKVGDMPMAEVIVKNLRKCGAERIVTVVGYGREKVEAALNGMCEFAVQEPQLGTGHAVMQAEQLRGETGATLVVNGDAATIQPETLTALYDSIERADMAVLTVSLPDAGAYGRVIRNENGDVLRIVEFKDCSPEEAAVHEINTGIYAFRNEKLFEALQELTNDNAQHEYYITDLVAIFRRKGWSVTGVVAEDMEEAQGVNDCVELARANRWLNRTVTQKWMKAGVQFADPDASYVGPFVTIGHDTEIYPNVYLYGTTALGNNVTVMPGAFLRNVTVKDGATVPSGTWENCEIG